MNKHDHTDVEMRAPSRVLLLEDDPGNAALIQTYIGMIEPASITLVSSIAAFERVIDDAKAGTFDLLILDIALPDGESPSYVKPLRDAGVKRIAAFTGRTSEADVTHFQNCGFVHIFEKPILYSRFKSEYRDLMNMADDEEAIA